MRYNARDFIGNETVIMTVQSGGDEYTLTTTKIIRISYNNFHIIPLRNISSIRPWSDCIRIQAYGGESMDLSLITTNGNPDGVLQLVYQITKRI